VRHVTTETSGRIASLLDEIRSIDGLVEKSPAHFYRKSQGFLHFHEDGDDVYADVRLQSRDFERVRVTTKTEQRKLIADIRRCLGAS
jgi:hypothetical protein